MISTPAPLEFLPLAPTEYAADWLVRMVWEDAIPPDPLTARLREAGDLTGRPLELVPVLTPEGFAAKRVLYVGLGPRAGASRSTFHDAAAAAARHVTAKKCDRAAIAFPDAPTESAVLGVACGLMQGSTGPGLRKAEPARYLPGRWVILADSPAANRATAEARAMTLARELVNLPPNELYPETFAERVRDNAAEYKIDCKIWDEAELKAGRMDAILGVARGSERPPRLAVLRYSHGDAAKTLALVGKGVTFDSGGLSLKTNDQMVDMKCDMAGAAAVLAATLAVAELRLPVNLIAVMPLVENMPGGRALKLGDVLKSRSGKTIEILNTDAEGRVILADALHYATELKATHIVDLATLTGACMVALGSEVAGLMANNADWGEAVRLAGKEAGERVWPLPMDAHYGEALHSNVADLKNAPGTRYGGAITAAKFLEQFVGATPWAHLDIAGPAWAEREGPTRDAGGTGFGVRLLVELAHRYAG